MIPTSLFGSLFLYVPWAFALYLIAGAVYRLYLSPLSKFPGPKLAALTLWYEVFHLTSPILSNILRYESYYDVILGGQYTFHIKKLHDQYGPIIRINPYELHISDPSCYDTLYASSAGGEERDKVGMVHQAVRHARRYVLNAVPRPAQTETRGFEPILFYGERAQIAIPAGRQSAAPCESDSRSEGF